MTDVLRWVIINTIHALPAVAAYYIGKAVARREQKRRTADSGSGGLARPPESTFGRRAS